MVGLLCGSEGTLGIVTKVWCRLVKKAKAFRTALAIFDDTGKACRAVAEIIAAGIVPAALEMMDALIIQAVEAAFKFGFPLDAPMLAGLKYGPAQTNTPAFWRASLHVETPGDTFLDLHHWGKGVVWVNGHCLGRYWNIGPQQRLSGPG